MPKKRYLFGIGVYLLILSASGTAVAQNGGSTDGALIDIIIRALEGFLETFLSPVEKTIARYSSQLVETIVGTPHPNSVFTRPTNAAWPRLYDYYWNSIVPLALSLYGVAIGLVILLETTSHLFSSYHRSKLKKRAFTGLLGILSWWWIAAISLRFMDALTGFLAPSLSNITLFETASFSGMGVLGVVVALGADFALFALLAVIYLARQVILYLFVLWMPILLVLWIPGVGPFAMLARLSKKLAGFYAPFLIMTLPVAILFRLGQLLGQSFGPSMGGIGAWLTAIVIPFIAVVSPLVLIWQAGGIFFIGDRMARRVSAQQATRRVNRTRATTREAAHGGRNFARGVRGKPAVQRNGQTLLDSGDSRAHATGSRLNDAGSRATPNLRSDGGTTTADPHDERTDRAHDFENLRDR